MSEKKTPAAGQDAAQETTPGAPRARWTTKRSVTADNGKVYEIPEWAPKRVRLDKHGRPDLFMNPAIFGAAAKPSAVTPPKGTL